MTVRIWKHLNIMHCYLLASVLNCLSASVGLFVGITRLDENVGTTDCPATTRWPEYGSK